MPRTRTKSSTSGAPPMVALKYSPTFDTEGRGSGGVNDPLESQGSVTLSQDQTLLFAANAASGTISVFRVHDTDLDILTPILLPVLHKAARAIALPLPVSLRDSVARKRDLNLW